MQSHVDAYLSHLLDTIVPEFQSVPGLLAIKVLRRSLVAYEEITMITTWKSGERIPSFRGLTAAAIPEIAVLERESPHDYEVVFDADRSSRD